MSALRRPTSYNLLDLPQPWGKTRFLLVGPRVDMTFTNTLYFTVFVQYNEQIKNMNINTRLQWRYKPASDFFLVYTDNYYTNAVFGAYQGRGAETELLAQPLTREA